MGQPYIKRSLEPVLEQAAREFPVVVLTGPRQSGKTTLLQHVFGQGYAYVGVAGGPRRDAAPVAFVKEGG